MHLVMFDIDGTLVDSAGFDSALYVEAVQHVLKVEIDSDWNTYEHVSDSGILAEVAAPRAARRRARRAPRACSSASSAGPFATLVGAARSSARGGCQRCRARVPVATRRRLRTARLKLAHVGIDVERLGFASSSDARARTDIMRLAAERAMQGTSVYTRHLLRRRRVGPPRGASALGYDFIAVGKAVPHAVAYADLRETEAILAQLGVS